MNVTGGHRAHVAAALAEAGIGPVAEAERRGAERGWDEGRRDGATSANPYREPENSDCLRCGRPVMRAGIRTDEGWFHVGCYRDDAIQRDRAARAAAERGAS